MRMKEEHILPLVDLLQEAHEKDRNKNTFSRRKAEVLMKYHIDNPKALILTNKNITAILAIIVQAPQFSTENQLSIIHSYSQTRGGWFRLLKEAKPWIRSWGVKDKLMFSTGTDEVNNMLERHGLKKIGVIFDIGDL